MISYRLPQYFSISVFLIISFFVFATPTVAAEASCLPAHKVMPWEHNKKICPTPTKKPIPTETKEVLGTSTNSSKPPSLDAEKLFVMINEHRAKMGLPAFEKDEKLCQLARERGPELYDEIFKTGNIHGGLYNRKLPYWVTENMKYGPSEQEAFNWWLSSPIHRKAIESHAKYSCGECYGNSCAQLFTSYVPK